MITSSMSSDTNSVTWLARNARYVGDGGLLLLTFVVGTDTRLVQDGGLKEPEPTWRIFLWQFLQPPTL